MASIKRILVNASAAKLGGAETIIRTFVENIPCTNDKIFIILSPLNFAAGSPNIIFKYKKTDGFQTVFFTCVGILVYMIKYKTKSVLSFNNLNNIFFPKKGVTYFHQLKALNGNSRELKLRLYDFIIKGFLKKNIFVVQSHYIKNLFISKYHVSGGKVLSCWPGFILPIKISAGQQLEKKSGYTGIFPVAFDTTHKNIPLLLEMEEFFLLNAVKIITLLPKSSRTENPDVYSTRGAVTREELFKIYNEADFLIFTSTEETVGLPIFEFLQSGKPVFVFAAAYAVALHKQFNEPLNFILFTDKEDFQHKFSKHISVFDNSIDYSKGEWEKIFNLL